MKEEPRVQIVLPAREGEKPEITLRWRDQAGNPAEFGIALDCPAEIQTATPVRVRRIFGDYVVLESPTLFRREELVVALRAISSGPPMPYEAER